MSETKSKKVLNMISNHLVKKYFCYSREPLSYIKNASVHKGIFPFDVKFGIIKSCLKQGDPNYLDNCRPIILLSVFSIIFQNEGLFNPRHIIP